MPSTVLQKQLAKINGGKERQRSLHASLLFDRSKDIELREVYDLARSAFEQLIALDDKFNDFMELFSMHRMSVFRSSLTIKENEELSALIKRFLLVLSPYFLQSSSFKVLEYMIRHYKINEYNVDEIMESILCYHETRQFVQVVSTLVIKEDSQWAFLKSVQKSMIPLDRKNLIKRCALDSSVLTFILNSLESSQKMSITHVTLVTFFNCTMIEYLQGKVEIKDNDMTLMMPRILALLKFRNDKNLQASLVMILNQIASKCAFEEKLLGTILERMALEMDSESIKFMIHAMAVMVHLQSSKSTILPYKVIQVLRDLRGAFDELISFSRNFNSGKFLCALFHAVLLACIQEQSVQELVFVEKLLRELNLDAQVSQFICELLLRKVKNSNLDISQKLFSVVHKEMPDTLNNTLSNYLAKLTEAEMENDFVFNLTKKLLENTLSEPLNSTGSSLLLSLEHPHAPFRCMAVKKLAETIKSTEETGFDESEMENVILRRLCDEDESVLKAVLKMGNLDKLISYPILMSELIGMMWKRDLKSKTMILAMKSLIRYYVTGRDDTIDSSFKAICYCFLFGFKGKNEITFAILDELNASQPKMLHDLRNSDLRRSQSKEDGKHFNLKLLQAIAETSSDDIQIFIEGFRNGNDQVKSVFGLILNEFFQRKHRFSEYQVNDIILAIETELLDNSTIVEKKLDYESLSDKSILSGNIFYQKYSVLMLLFKNLIQVFVDLLEDASNLSTHIISLISKVPDRQLLSNFLLEYFKTYKGSVVDLCCLHISNLEISSDVRFLSLNILFSYLKSVEPSRDLQLMIPYILISGYDKDKYMRQAALEIIKHIDSHCEGVQKDCYYPINNLDTSHIVTLKPKKVKYLCTSILSKKIEIIADQLELISLLGRLSDERYLYQTKCSDIVKFLVSFVTSSSCRIFQDNALVLLSEINSVDKFKGLFPIISKLSCVEESPNMAGFIRSFTPSVGKWLASSKSSKYFQSLLKLLSQSESPSIVLDTLHVITPTFFCSINEEQQIALVGKIYHILSYQNNENVKAARSTMCQLHLSAGHIIPIFDLIKEEIGSDSEGKKKAKFEKSQSNSLNGVITCFLEILDSKKNIDNNQDLLVGLFDILKGLLSLEANMYEYVKQLILAIMKAILASLGERNLRIDSNVIHIDTLLQCIRVTDNLQTHNCVFDVLSVITNMHPQLVLTSVMPIFTFMGTNILRQDDDFSFFIIKKTITTIVPALVQNGGMNAEVESVLDVFLTALYHIPSHRRLPIYKILVQELGTEIFLGKIILMLINNDITANKNLPGFSALLLAQFTIVDQIKALTYLSNSANEPSESEFCNSELVLSFMKRCLKNDNFTSLITAADFEIEEGISTFVQSLLQGICSPQANERSERLEVFNLIIGLLPCSQFIKTINSLIHNSDEYISVKAISIFEDRIKSCEYDPQSCYEYLPLMKSLVNLVKLKNNSSERVQAIFACFGELARTLAESHPDDFTGIIPIIIGNVGLQNQNIAVVAASMITLNYFTRSLGPRMLPFLPKFVPTVFDILRNDIESGSKDSLICITSFMTINVTIEVLPQFFSSYSSKVIEIVVNQNIKGSKSMDTLSNTLNTMAEFILPRNLLPSIFKHAADISRAGESLATLIFNFIGNILGKITKADILEFRSDLIKFFLGAFDIRLNNYQGMSPDQILSLENCIISSFFQLILKLNDENFKPMYLKMVDWATLSISFDQLEEGNMIKRQITFYHIIDEILNRLKVLSVPYYSYTIDSSLSILNKFINTPEYITLWQYCLSSIQKYFQYNDQEGIDDSKFEKLLEALLGQLNLVSEFGDDYIDLMTSHIVPCIAQLALFCKNESQRKQINKSLCLKTRSNESEIRLLTVLIMKQVYKLVGEPMLNFFPETIPFIAELMEDDSVEEATQELCLVIQDHLGEPIQQYFQ